MGGALQKVGQSVEASIYPPSQVSETIFPALKLIISATPETRGLETLNPNFPNLNPEPYTLTLKL